MQLSMYAALYSTVPVMSAILNFPHYSFEFLNTFNDTFSLIDVNYYTSRLI